MAGGPGRGGGGTLVVAVRRCAVGCELWAVLYAACCILYVQYRVEYLYVLVAILSAGSNLAT